MVSPISHLTFLFMVCIVIGSQFEIPIEMAIEMVRCSIDCIVIWLATKQFATNPFHKQLKKIRLFYIHIHIHIYVRW